MNAKQRCKLRRMERRRLEREELAAESRLAQKVDLILSGCSSRISKAIFLPSLRTQQQSGSVCLPQVALYAAGFRKARKGAVHFVK